MLVCVPDCTDLFLNKESIIMRCKDLQQLLSMQGCESPWASWERCESRSSLSLPYSSTIKVDQPLSAKSGVKYFPLIYSFYD